MRFSSTTKELTQQIRCSETTLRRLRREGVLKPGVHFIGLGTGTKSPTLAWSLEAVEEALRLRSRRALAA